MENTLLQKYVQWSVIPSKPLLCLFKNINKNFSYFFLKIFVKVTVVISVIYLASDIII